MKARSRRKSEVRTEAFNLAIFTATFLLLALLFTVQMLLLGRFIDYTEIPTASVVAVLLYWMAVAAAFTLVTLAQIHRRYQKPMEQFGDAARRVADGDFSVYVPSRNRADKADYLDAIFSDFNKMVEELGSIETLKTEFFSNVSHEMKTPLSVIQNYAEMLQKDNLTQEQRADYADTILTASRRLTSLITNMLKLNKLEKQRILPMPEPYDLCRQLCECALLFEEQWEKKGIAFVADIEEKATIHADASLLEIVWSNLLSNAVKFTPTGGTIALTQTSTDQDVTVTVSDTGCGMDDETARHMFDKFYQGDTSHATEGNGLGLAIVSRIIELVDGSISVHSAPNEGTTFAVRIPLKCEEEIDHESIHRL